MSKTGAATTLPADGFVALAEVFAEDALAVAEQLNWSAGQRPVVHYSMAIGPSDWDHNGALPTIGIKFPAGSGWQRCLVFKIVVSADTQAIVVGARCYVSAGTCDLRVTIGGAAAATLSFTSADNGNEKSTSIATSSSGTGELVVTLERAHSSGSATDCFVRELRVEDAPIDAGDLPDPEDA